MNGREELQARMEELHNQGRVHMPFSAISFGGNGRIVWAFGGLQVTKTTGVRSVQIEAEQPDREAQIERLREAIDIDLLRQGNGVVEGQATALPWEDIVEEATRTGGHFWALKQRGVGWFDWDAALSVDP